MLWLDFCVVQYWAAEAGSRERESVSGFTKSADGGQALQLCDVSRTVRQKLWRCDLRLIRDRVVQVVPTSQPKRHIRAGTHVI